MTPIPAGYENDAVLKTVIAICDDYTNKYNSNKKVLPVGSSFTSTDVTVNETYKLLMKMDCKCLLDSIIFSVYY